MITGGQGQVSKRKRVKGKIGDANSKPELKFCSCVDNSSTGSYALAYFPGVHNIANVQGPQLWKPYMLDWPQQGADKDERIGKKIRVKYLRVKGFAASSPLLIDQVRWRLVLYRTKKHYIETGGTYSEGYGMDWLKELYRKFYDMDTNSLSTNQLNCVLNYYVSYFNPQNMGDEDCKRRILLKGMFNPNADIGNYTQGNRSITGTVGNQNAALALGGSEWSGRFLLHFSGDDIGHVANMNAYFPIDLTVAMNDNIDTEEYRYLLVFETDCIVGENQAGSYNINISQANFIFGILPQIYYTDD